ncbi:hypothetical protein HPB49_006609 [Dermacentor silvarum]|uniref:Uncharacterized protein n=1 Tax=Dermacentor silvarum TaxID=543639 RepID=A0ACB8C7Q7_DERSI|nr:hypothetical protein HPB49_006609 [Dermacentor silvarum]
MPTSPPGQGEFRSLVAWLEDQKIRHYKLEERAALRALDAPGWMQAFETYLQDLACPHKGTDTKTVLDWLLGMAVHLEYSDDHELGLELSKAIRKPEIVGKISACGASADEIAEAVDEVQRKRKVREREEELKQCQLEQLKWSLTTEAEPSAVNYDMRADKYVEASKKAEQDTGAPKMVHANPLDDLDFDCQEFRQGVQALAQYLGVTQHPDHLVTLQSTKNLASPFAHAVPPLPPSPPSRRHCFPPCSRQVSAMPGLNWAEVDAATVACFSTEFLQTELIRRGIDATGSRDDLIQRLTACLEEARAATLKAPRRASAPVSSTRVQFPASPLTLTVCQAIPGATSQVYASASYVPPHAAARLRRRSHASA